LRNRGGSGDKQHRKDEEVIHKRLNFFGVRRPGVALLSIGSHRDKSGARSPHSKIRD